VEGVDLVLGIGELKQPEGIGVLGLGPPGFRVALERARLLSEGG